MVPLAVPGEVQQLIRDVGGTVAVERLDVLGEARPLPLVLAVFCVGGIRALGER